MKVARVRIAAGLTLVELLVAMTVGLGVALIAMRLMLLANDAYAAGSEGAAVEDNGRFAIEMLGRAVRQAASFDPDAVPAAPAAADLPARLGGLDAHSLARTTPALEAPLPGAVNGSDVLAVRFTGAADGGALGCAGFPVAPGEEGWSIFYVARSAAGDAELRCKYEGRSGWTSDALVGGVDGFQVLYGIDTDTPLDGTPNRYVNADAVRGLDAALPPGARSWWTRVAAVRIGLLLHGARPLQRAGRAHYDLLGPVYAAAGALDAGSSLDETALAPNLQRRERRLFANTVALPAPPAYPP